VTTKSLLQPGPARGVAAALPQRTARFPRQFCRQLRGVTRAPPPSYWLPVPRPVPNTPALPLAITFFTSLRGRSRGAESLRPFRCKAERFGTQNSLLHLAVAKPEDTQSQMRGTTGGGFARARHFRGRKAGRRARLMARPGGIREISPAMTSLKLARPCVPAGSRPFVRAGPMPA